MGVVDTVRILAEGARYGVTFKNGLPSPDQWGRIAFELDALPSGAWWQLEYLGYQIVLVNGPCHLVAGIDPATVPATVNGFTAYGKCIASVPVAYPAGTATTSRAVLHEPGHACDLVPNDPAWPYSRQGDWLAINAAHGWGDPGESWPEQFGHWCLHEKYFDPLADDVRDYFRGKAYQRGWYYQGGLYWPR